MIYLAIYAVISVTFLFVFSKVQTAEKKARHEENMDVAMCEALGIFEEPFFKQVYEKRKSA